MEKHLDGILKKFIKMYLSLTRITKNKSAQDLQKCFVSTMAVPSDPYSLSPMDPTTTEEERWCEC
jgi:hypothetical protein